MKKFLKLFERLVIAIEKIAGSSTVQPFGGGVGDPPVDD